MPSPLPGLTAVPSLGQLSGVAPEDSFANPGDELGDDDEKEKQAAAGLALQAGEGTQGVAMSLLAKSLTYNATKDTLTYTFAYWIKWKPMETLSDQMLFFGETRNMPALVRGNKLGALVDNHFCATDFDPRLAGDNWCLVIITNDGAFSKFYIGYSSKDRKGMPQAAKAAEAVPGHDPSKVRTEVDANVQIRRLVTTSKGAGLLAQAWIWPRDLEPEEIEELWVETKARYPLWKPGMSSYRPPPSAGKKGKSTPKIDPAKGKKTGGSGGGSGDPGSDAKVDLPWEKFDPIIEKDNALMLEIPLASKLAFQRLKNVFAVLVDYATYSESFLVIDRIHNPSPTAELMIEVAMRANTGSPPTSVMVMDSRTRLERANKMLEELIHVGFLIDQESEYRKVVSTDQFEEPKLTEWKLTATDYAGPKADLRRLVTPAGLAWLRSSNTSLKDTRKLIDDNPRKPEHRDMTSKVTAIYREHGLEKDLQADGRPTLSYIWRVFYDAQLFASGTHYIIFDTVEVKGKPVISTLGTIGTIFIAGSTDEHRKIVECIQDGSPLLLLESTGGVTQAFAYVMKAVRMMKPKWPIDFVLRLVTEYKQRAAKSEAKDKALLPLNSRQFVLPNIQLLDKELARIDMLLAAGEHQESWMRNFGLPEVLMLFEIWQRSPDFLLKQIQTADVMKRSAEDLLDLFTACFSTAAAVPELGLGNAETKVVATAWNRHLILFNNATIYAKRSWTMTFVLYFLALCTTSLSIITANYVSLQGNGFLEVVMLILPIASALLGTVGTRLRQQQKYSTCKMASYEIVSEIYKFRVRAIEYDAAQLAIALRAAQEGPGDKKKKKDDEPVAPISNKDKDRLARKMFVTRIQDIYTDCMMSEMSKGTSVRHKTGGMDPKRLLLEDDDESERKTQLELQKHVANRLYFIQWNEWVQTAEVVKMREESQAMANREAFVRGLKQKRNNVIQTIMSIGLALVIVGVRLSFLAKAKLDAKIRKMRGEEPVAGTRKIQKAAGRITATPGEDGGDSDPADEAAVYVAKLKEKFAALFHLPAESKLTDDEEAQMMEEEAVPHGQDVKMLDTTYIEDDEVAGGGGGGDDDEGGGGLRIRDNMLGGLTIDDYMRYRARPICTYLERTAPWRAFELQCLEVTVFVINSMGAVLVALGNVTIPYVALTVSVAAVCKSFIEFSRLDKQVEAYNTAQRDIYKQINDWDGMTRTQRRTRTTITNVVFTVENAMSLVAVALTDAIPSNQQKGDDADEDGDKDD